MIYFSLLLGLVLLVVGANFFVEYSVRVAKYLRLSIAVFGGIVVAIGTSLPEIAVTLQAGSEGLPDIIVGNILGSNISNIGLILGLAFLLSRVKIHDNEINRESHLMLILSLVFVGLVVAGLMSLIAGIVLLITSAFLIANIIKKRTGLPLDSSELKGRNLPISLLVLAGSLAGVFLGSRLAVDSSVQIASVLDLSLEFIAATLIAVGTSLPELVITLSAARKHESELAIGNIIGSNLFNITLVGGIGGLYGNLDHTPPEYIIFFLLFALAGFLLGIGKLKPSRAVGTILLVLYVTFLVFAY